MNTIFRALKERDTAIVFLDKIIVAIKGPVIIAAILLFLNVTEQGFWYTFISLSALTGLAELGFTTIISQFVSHEYANLRFRNGYLVGKRFSLDKAFGLVRYAIRVYCYIVPIAIVILIVIGGYFFSDESYQILVIWLAYCVLSGLNLVVSLLQSIYKGFDKVYKTHLIKILSNVCSILFLVLALACDLGLAALPVSMLFLLLPSSVLLFRMDKRFWCQIIRHKIINKHSWFHEIISLQSKYAVSFLCGYFIFNLFVPLSFKYQGAIIAGQLGLTLTIAKAMSAFTYVWIQSKLPTMNMMAARKQRNDLKNLFLMKTKLSMLTFFLGAIMLIFLAYIANKYSIYQTRVLKLPEILLVLSSELAVVCMSIYAIYVRAHKIEPVHYPSLISAIFIAIIAFYFITESDLYNLYIVLNIFQWLVMLPMFLFAGKKAMNKYYLQRIEV
ncbi:MAG: hypothetical protein GQ532_08520 [Methylomarinum sp.]|nr:hypothetical protein [Methylomarinum sp.]